MGIGFKIPLGEVISSGGESGDLTGRLKLVKFTELGISQSTTLSELVPVLLGFLETPFVTYIWLDNQTTLSLWNEVKSKVDITLEKDELSFGNLECRVCNGVIHFRYEMLSGDIIEFAYTNYNSIGMIDAKTILYSDSDSKNNVVSFSSNDTEVATSWRDVDVLNTNETHSSILNKISSMFNNIRWLKTKVNGGSVIETDDTALTSQDIKEATTEVWDGSTTDDITALSREDVTEATETAWDGSTTDDITALSSTDVADATK